MTNTRSPLPKSRRNLIPRLTPGQWFFCFFGVFSLFLTVRNSEAAIGFVSDGLRLCTGTVIPSLFPFLVVSELLVLSGTGEVIGQMLSGPFCRMFDISGPGFTVFFLGSLCGFPVGARTAVSYYDRGLLTKKETERILTFTNNPSSAFLISAVGVSLFGSQAYGIVLFVVTLLSASVIGFFGKFFLSEEKNPRNSPQKPPKTQIKTGVGVFTNAVSGASGSMLRVCSYVIFFTALTGTLKLFLEAVHANEAVSAILTGFCELTTGVRAAAGINGRLTGAVLAAFFAGWSGLSVHMQILSITDGRGLCYRPYFLAKFLQGLLAGTVMWGVLHRFPQLLDPSEKAVFFKIPDGGEGFGGKVCLVTVAVFLLGTLILFLRHRKSKRKVGTF